MLDVMHMMREKGYSYVPIVEHGVVEGVFSENSLFTYFISENKLSLDNHCTIDDLDGCIALHNHMSERFEFVPRDMPAVDVVEMFSKDMMGGKRLAAVFVTQNGKADEKMLGMISSWDVIDFVDEMVL
jgi:predicted transcriptional regulator